MPASFVPDDHERILALERTVRELQRKRPRDAPRFGDLRDVNGWGALDGYQFFYDASIGRQRPGAPPAFTTFHMLGDIEVREGAHFPVPFPVRLFAAAAKLTVAGGSTTTALLKHRTTTVATYTFAAGNEWPNSQPDISEACDGVEDYLWMDVTAAGSGAQELVLGVWAAAGAAP